MDPLFPRLHINDADKGGPRAPPRNKMALCEQYNVPSQNPSPRFNSGSMAMLSLQTTSSSSTTSTHVESPTQKVLPSFCSLPGPSHFALTERYRSYYSGGLNFNTSQSTESSSKPHCFPTFSIKRSGDDLRVPSFAQPHLECKRDGTSGIPERIMRKRCSSAMDDASQPFPILEDKNESIKECSNCKDCESVRVGNADNSEESSDTSVTESISGLELTPDDVIRVIGQRLFWKARKTIIHQQRLFSVQIFELHRLIKVQRLITGSPDVLHENNFNLNKPSIKFPPMNKLLYVTPLDPSPVIIKPKAGTLKSNPSKDHGQEPVCAQLPTPLNNAQQSSLNPSPTPASIPIDAKLPPLYFHPPPGNQWLVPVRSPSEGLIYKPYTGPCPPTAGIMSPVFGNCGPIGLNSVAGKMPGPRFSGTALGQSYLQPYAMPLLNASSANLEPEQVTPFDVNLTIPCRSSCSLSSKPSGVVSECSKGSEVQGSSATSPDRFQGDVLSLFPTTPSVQVSKDKCTEQKVQVIKVVPHNPRLATESAARIFQSIQEERKKT
ncbi:hypothetical protein ACJIZ3_025430 [Penstemon smallii]|uniref:Protein EARLY FLOWERING 3-like n=1 Tax=Penstemon smallii TaxID=265156 RepID=A0ABD3TUK1_9LAMI